MTTALALRPMTQSIEFRRCTGHCCRNINLGVDPGQLRWNEQVGRSSPRDKCLSELLVYHGWLPPSQGGWPETGSHHYSCRALQSDGGCALHGTGKKPRMCTDYPEYFRGPWIVCEKPGCTRRTMVLEPDRNYELRHCFPDLRKADAETKGER